MSTPQPQIDRSIWRHASPVFVIFIALITILLVPIRNVPLAAQTANDIALPIILKPPLAPLCGEIVEFGGAIETDTTLDPSKTYIVNGDIVVRPQVTLTILPGTVLKFTYDRGIQVEGKLLASGSVGNPVYFTSTKDDTLCGDTNNDGTASIGSTGDWRWIEFTAESDPSSVIQNAVVRYGGKNESGLSDDWRAPIRIFNVTPTFDRITFEDNYRNAVQLIGGDWTANVIDDTTIVYWLYDRGNLVVLPRNTLTIGAGVKIKIDYDHGILVHGTLNAVGQPDRAIVFTSTHDDTVCGVGAGGESVCDTNNNGTASIGNAGDWRWIEFTAESDPNSIVRNVVVRYGGKNESGLSDDWRAPIRIFNVTPTFDLITFEHNYRNAVQLIGGDWTANVIDDTTIIYWLYDRGNLVVLPRNVLTIAPGVKIKVDYSHGILVNGTLNAIGNLDNPITFTSTHDDTVCGVGVEGEEICDTNNNGTASIGNAGDWRWIEFTTESDPNSAIQYAVVRYGGKNESGLSDDWRATFMMISASPTVDHVEFDSNHRAIDFYDLAAPKLGCNDVKNSLSYGMYNHNPDNVVLAEGQWWGDVSGPTHPTNPSGTGETLENGIDFDPWSNVPCTNFGS